LACAEKANQSAMPSLESRGNEASFVSMNWGIGIGDTQY
jgi:hypothetical protein